jgi:hypothetical protein
LLAEKPLSEVSAAKVPPAALAVAALPTPALPTPALPTPALPIPAWSAAGAVEEDKLDAPLRRGEIGPAEKPNEVRPEVAGGAGP